MLDLLGAVELTASAAIVIGALSMGFGWSPGSRKGTAAVLSGWFAIVVALAATRAVHYRDGIGVAGLGLTVLLPILGLWTLVITSPVLKTALSRMSPPLLIGVQAVRVLGITFVLLYEAGRLPAPFAPVAGWGDVLVGLAALPIAAYVAARGLEKSRAIVTIFTGLGLADLATAIGLGVLSSPGPVQVFVGPPDTALMSLLPWLLIPGFLVPLLFIAHLAIVYQ